MQSEEVQFLGLLRNLCNSCFWYTCTHKFFIGGDEICIFACTHLYRAHFVYKELKKSPSTYRTVCEREKILLLLVCIDKLDYASIVIAHTFDNLSGGSIAL